MNIEILYFAMVRERAGCAGETIELPAGATLADAIAAIVARHAAVEPLLPHVRFAVNETFVRGQERPLADGDVLAVIPPVAGGAPLAVVTSEPLDARAVEAAVAGPDRGGVVTFTGVVRDHTGDARVERLEYEAYVPMAERVLEAIRGEAEEKWPGVRVAVRHRVGVLAVGEAAVVIAASAPHRAEAFAACAYVIERLKEDVPIFKKEVRADGSVWVGHGP